MEVSLVWSIISSRGDPPISSSAPCPNSPDDDDEEEEQDEEGGDPPIIRLEKLAWHVLDAIMLYGEQHRVMGMSLIEDMYQAMEEFYLNSKSEIFHRIFF